MTAAPSPVIIAMGMNHRTASLSLRQHLALTGETLQAALNHLGSAGVQGVILSTCNRSEFYVCAPNLRQGWRQLDAFLTHHLGMTTREVMAHTYGYEGEEVVRHLFRVACGLDSLVLGEAQILGQVRAAGQAAEAAGVAGPYLSRLFRQAVSVARRVRSATGLGQGSASVGTAAVSLARKEMGDLSGRPALVIGAGHMARLVARALTKEGVASLTVVSRTRQKARELAAWLGARDLPWAMLEKAVAQADIVVSCTSAPSPVLDRAAVERALATRGERPMLLIDIAVPRDIAPEVAELPQVHLYDIDQLCPDSLKSPPETEAAQAEALVSREAASFMAWLRSRQTVPAIQALRHRAEVARQRELAECLKKMPHLGTQERCHLEKMTTALVNKLIHGPIVYLKEVPAPSAAVEVVEGLFPLNGRRPVEATKKEAS